MIPRKVHPRALLLWTCALTGLMLIILLLKSQHIRLNLTASMPIGFYRRVAVTHIVREDFVAVCLPKVIAKEGLKRHYLIRGYCSSGAIAVLKEVIAVPHDRVAVSNRWITVNHISYFAPYQPYDSRGKPTRRFISNGMYQTAGYWLYGSHDFIRSWDSRYYGSVLRKDIIGIYRPLLTF